ncbi:hypothetical protein WJX72_010830 [[Myrmecia] bisecta]|uniref:Uncharacterized protein n=1 Tax=[Myrmecia] bisecta TaxID=41462 RepID=A0AAW1QA67_9CHLO
MAFYPKRRLMSASQQPEVTLPWDLETPDIWQGTQQPPQSRKQSVHQQASRQPAGWSGSAPQPVSALSLETYSELQEALTKGTGSAQPVPPVERAFYKLNDLKQLLLIHGIASGSKGKQDLLDRMAGLQLLSAKHVPAGGAAAALSSQDAAVGSQAAAHQGGQGEASAPVLQPGVWHSKKRRPQDQILSMEPDVPPIAALSGTCEAAELDADLPGGSLVGRRVASVLLEDFEQDDPRGVVDVIRAGLHDGRVVEHIGHDHDPDVCSEGCTCPHNFYYVRMRVDESAKAGPAGRARLPATARRLDLKLDLHASRLCTSLQQLLTLDPTQLQDAWVLLQPRQVLLFGSAVCMEVLPGALDRFGHKFEERASKLHSNIGRKAVVLAQQTQAAGLKSKA